MTYKCIDAYVAVEDPENWNNCPICGLTPKIWSFDNGRSTACGCGESRYDHFSIHAESIMSVITRNNGSAEEYNNKELMQNWNRWVLNGKIVFDRSNKREDGRW